MNFDTAFWNALDALVNESEVVIDRPKGSHHPKFPEIVYPVDYGYLENTTSMDGGVIDTCVALTHRVKLMLLCVLSTCGKRSEIKILIGCTDDEKELILKFIMITII